MRPGPPRARVAAWPAPPGSSGAATNSPGRAPGGGQCGRADAAGRGPRRSPQVTAGACRPCCTAVNCCRRTVRDRLSVCPVARDGRDLRPLRGWPVAVEIQTIARHLTPLRLRARAAGIGVDRLVLDLAVLPNHLAHGPLVVQVGGAQAVVRPMGLVLRAVRLARLVLRGRLGCGL